MVSPSLTSDQPLKDCSVIHELPWEILPLGPQCFQVLAIKIMEICTEDLGGLESELPVLFLFIIGVSG